MSKLALAAAAALVLFAGQAMADEVSTAVVPTAAVDFNNRAQVDALYSHVRAVARDLCATDANPYGYSSASSVTQCVNEAVSQAVAKANRPLLTAAAEGRTSDGQRANRALAGNDQ